MGYRLRVYGFVAMPEHVHLLLSEDKLNQRPLQKREGSRLSLFRELDQPALGAQPAERFEWSRRMFSANLKAMNGDSLFVTSDNPVVTRDARPLRSAQYDGPR